MYPRSRQQNDDDPQALLLALRRVIQRCTAAVDDAIGQLGRRPALAQRCPACGAPLIHVDIGQRCARCGALVD